MKYSNVFVLNSGRCGSTSFIKACSHISNYSSSHESRVHLTGDPRLAYPASHIEADNRLSWFLGRLDRAFGDQAFYVYLKRAREQVVNSFVRREHFGIMKAYRDGILMNVDEVVGADEIASDYLDTIDANIELFLKDKTNHMVFQLEQAKPDFELFWNRISATGDYRQALAEWDISYNSSKD